MIGIFFRSTPAKVIFINGTLIILTMLGAGLCLYYWDYFTFDKFIDRDLYRSIFPDKNFFLSGSELNGGGRTPGGFLNLILWLMYHLGNESIVGTYIVYVLTRVLALFLLARTLEKYFVRPISLVLISVILISFFQFEQFLALWNPTLSFIFATLSFTLIFPLTLEKKYSNLSWITLCISLASQLHTSNAVLFPVTILVLFLTKTKVPIRYIILSLTPVLLVYAPFILNKEESALFVQSINVDGALSGWEYIKRLWIVLTNLNGIIVGHNESLQWLPRTRLTGLQQIILFLISVFPLVGIFFLYGKKGNFLLKDHAKMNEGNALRVLKSYILCCLLLFIPILCLSFDNEFIALRRFLWAGPAFSSLLALGLTAILTRITNLKSWSPTIIAGTMLIAYGLGQTYYTVSNLDITPENFFLKNEIMDVARKEFHFDHYAIQTKIGLISKDPESGFWGIRSYQIDDGTGLVSLLASPFVIPPIADKSDICMMVVLNQEEEFQEILDEIKDEAVFQVKKVISGKYGTYFSYPKIQNNCISYFNNYYFMPEKAEMFQILKDKRISDYNMQFEINTKDTLLFNHSVDNDIYLFYIKFEQINDSFIGKIFVSTREINRYNGIGYLYENDKGLFQSRIVFIPEKGISAEMPLFEQPGHLTVPLTMPFFFKVPKPSGGRYRLTFKIQVSPDMVVEKSINHVFTGNKTAHE